MWAGKRGQAMCVRFSREHDAIDAIMAQFNLACKMQAGGLTIFDLNNFVSSPISNIVIAANLVHVT